jgi:hypothetical protein
VSLPNQPKEPKRRIFRVVGGCFGKRWTKKGREKWKKMLVGGLDKKGVL